MITRQPLSRQVEESQRIARETRNRERHREQEMLNEKAKESAVFAERTAQLRATRLAKEAGDREVAQQALAAKLAAPAKKATRTK
ncbi:hypothetical protein [Dongia rigui]|uniref:Uncharacterized protein n=1 Tax=Dongia rigui TaxID=940149 RepID=A0ABU5E1L8_9PROT|nr:hypothetical protein [Dongia rigui]MDY0873124.1 hypothetical protein [Dongia rigui]